MNKKTLETLVIDRLLGELSPEAEELLDAWIALHPESETEIPVIEEAVALTEEVIGATPWLFEEGRLQPEGERAVAFFSTPAKTGGRMSGALRMAAALAVLLMVAGGLGYLAGSHQAPETAFAQRGEAVETTSTTHPRNGESDRAPRVLSTSPTGPWARYQLTTTGANPGIAVVALPGDFAPDSIH